jgi:hypothetical protein
MIEPLFVNQPSGGPAISQGVPQAVTVVSSDSASALPNWLLIALLALVALIVIGMFALAAYSLSAPRSTLRSVLGQGRRRQQPPPGTVTKHLVERLATAARSGRRTTRTTLAIAGFSLLGVVIIAMFGLSGQGVRDLRAQVVASVTTLVAAIAGFYFGAQTAQARSASQAAPGTAPRLGPDPKNPPFTVGAMGTYTPALTGTPAPTVSLSKGPLPQDLQLDSGTGAITGTPAPGTAGEYDITLTASNGISPDAQLSVKLTVNDSRPVPGPGIAPGLGPDPQSPSFTVGAMGTYNPVLTGTPAPTVSLSGGTLPQDLQLDSGTGAITGKPAANTEGEYDITLTASNGISPDAQLSVKLTVKASQ